jgi:hypothetical protein
VGTAVYTFLQVTIVKTKKIAREITYDYDYDYDYDYVDVKSPKKDGLYH